MEEITGRAVIISGDGSFCMKEINEESNNKKKKEETKIKVNPLSLSSNHSTDVFNIKKREESQI